jgi:hypothetical protein
MEFFTYRSFTVHNIEYRNNVHYLYNEYDLCVIMFSIKIIFKSLDRHRF